MTASSALAACRCLLFDMDGTLYLGDQVIPGAQELIARLRAAAFPHYFLTNNSSRSKKDYVGKLNSLGLPAEESSIFTSGEATAWYLKARAENARIYLVGTPSLEEEFLEFGFELDHVEPEYCVLGFDTTLTYEKLSAFCGFIRRGLPYIATHPDVNCPTPDGFIPDIGAFMAAIEASTGRTADVIVGKPHPPIVEAITLKTGFQASEIGMVGDRLYTDIAMGQFGLKTVLVLSGEATRKDVPRSPFQPDIILESVSELLPQLPEIHPE